MSTKPEILAELVSTCPHCGAETPPDARYCWLCGAKQVADSAQLVPARPPIAAPRQRLLTGLAVLLVAVIGYGALRSQDRVIASIYLLGVVPALLVVLARAIAARRRGQPWSAGKTAAVAVTTIATTVFSAVVVALAAAAVMALMVVAALIALFTVCMAAAGGRL
jgi:ribosomal protein L40E